MAALLFALAPQALRCVQMRKVVLGRSTWNVPNIRGDPWLIDLILRDGSPGCPDDEAMHSSGGRHR